MLEPAKNLSICDAVGLARIDPGVSPKRSRISANVGARTTPYSLAGRHDLLLRVEKEFSQLD